MENNKFHILVVDDDNKIRDLLKQFLTDKGFIVSTAIDSQDAKSKIEIFNFNLLVLDVMMPGQTGYELTKELKWYQTCCSHPPNPTGIFPNVFVVEIIVIDLLRTPMLKIDLRKSPAQEL